MTSSLDSPVLPYELFDTIAQHLIGDNAFRTCANLNATSHAVKDVTLRTLWTNMCWTGIKDSGVFSEKVIEEKWEIMKKSEGAQHIRYMVEPALIKPGKRNEPLISKSLATSLKASITLVAKGKHTTPAIQLHLFEKYGYSLEDMASVWRALDIAKSTPDFEDVTEISVHVHSRPQLSAMGPGGMLDSDEYRELKEESDNDSDDGSSCYSGPGILFTPPVDAWLSSISLYVDDSNKLEVDDYIVLSTNIMIFLRPYAVERLKQKDHTVEAADLTIADLEIPAMLSFAAAYVRLAESDSLYTTLQVNLFLGDDDEDSYGPDPEQGGIMGLLMLLGLTRLNFQRAALSIPSNLLGGFEVYGGPEMFCASVRVNYDSSSLC